MPIPAPIVDWPGSHRPTIKISYPTLGILSHPLEAGIQGSMIRRQFLFLLPAPSRPLFSRSRSVFRFSAKATCSVSKMASSEVASTAPAPEQAGHASSYTPRYIDVCALAAPTSPCG